MYRYRDNAGSTHQSLDRAEKHLPKVGRILSIRGYRARTTKNPVYGATWTRVMVRGESGTARLHGFCWGYAGTGPHGLASLLTKCGVQESEAKQIAFNTPCGEGPGEDWKVTLSAAH